MEASRRTLLGAIAGAPALAFPTIAGGIHANIGVSSALSEAIAARRRAQAAASAHDLIWQTAWDAAQEAIAAIPHVRTANSWRGFKNERVTLTTEDADSIAVSRRALATKADRIKWETEDEFYDTLQEHVDAADAREAEAIRIREGHNLPAITTENNRLNDACVEAMSVVLAVPARSLADVLAKIEFIDHEDWDDDESAYAALAADVRRLAGGSRPHG